MTQPSNLPVELPPLAIAIAGAMGVGKTEFIASMPKPMLVIQVSDPIAKAAPYLRRGVTSPLVYDAVNNFSFYDVTSRRTGDRIIRVEFYIDEEPTIPRAFDGVYRRMQELRDEVREGYWRTVALEGLSGLDLAARYRREHGNLASDKDKANIYATNDVEQMLTRFAALNLHGVNVVIACHVDKDVVDPEGRVLRKKVGKWEAPETPGPGRMRTPKGPGRLQTGLGENFTSEVYWLQAFPDPEAPDGITRLLQTKNDGSFICASRIGAPNPCFPNYQSLWANWLAAQNGAAVKGANVDVKA